jgi:hypothetical protein
MRIVDAKAETSGRTVPTRDSQNRHDRHRAGQRRSGIDHGKLSPLGTVCMWDSHIQLLRFPADKDVGIPHADFAKSGRLACRKPQ